jgi:hypothetical protein
VLVACGAVALVLGAAAACEPQKIELFEPVSAGDGARDAGAGGSTDGTGGSMQTPPLALQPECETAACENCVEQGRCVQGQLCHAKSGRCLPACAPARTPSGCSADQRCHPEYVVCVDCVDATSCSGSTPECDPDEGRCVACVVDEHCDSPTAACDPQSHTCVTCTNDTHCAPGVCDEARHLCLDCESDEQCGGETRRCERTAGRCVECLSNADCTLDPDKPICKLDELECDDDSN